LIAGLSLGVVGELVAGAPLIGSLVVGSPLVGVLLAVGAAVVGDSSAAATPPMAVVSAMVSAPDPTTIRRKRAYDKENPSPGSPGTNRLYRQDRR
jgi:hypothetical protein